MGFIDMNLGNDVQEKECAPEGEYSLVVTDITLKEYDIESDDGEHGKGNRLECRIEIEGADEPFKPIYHSIFLPTQFDNKDKTYNKQLQTKRFLTAAQVPFDDTGFDPDDIKGARFDCALKIRTDDSGKYPPQNELDLPALERAAD